jgi:hypothetical protein
VVIFIVLAIGYIGYMVYGLIYRPDIVMNMRHHHHYFRW